jgi:hypothetical protein
MLILCLLFALPFRFNFRTILAAINDNRARYRMRKKNLKKIKKSKIEERKNIVKKVDSKV